MKLPQFEYLTPDSVQKACSLLAQYNSEAKILGGGSDLLVRMRQKVSIPSALISLKSVPQLNVVSHGDHGLKIGALATLHDIELSSLVSQNYPMISKTAGKVASYQIRSLCTIGGNICLETRCWFYNQSQWWRKSRSLCYKRGGDRCHVMKGSDRCYALSSADMVPALIAMDAEIKVVGPLREKVIALQDLYTGTGAPHLALKFDDIVTEIKVPKQHPNVGTEYVKLSLSKLVDFPVVGAAVAITWSDSGWFNAKIVINGVSSGPVIATRAGEMIQGADGKDWSLQEVAETVVKEIGPIVHIGVTPDYKRQMVKVVIRQAITEAMRRAKIGI